MKILTFVMTICIFKTFAQSSLKTDQDQPSQFKDESFLRADKIFSKPLIIFKSGDKALKYALIILEYLLVHPLIKKVYVEDLEEINFEILLKSKINEKEIPENIEILDNLDKKMIEKFDNQVSTPDLCIILGGDGTILWTNHLFGVNKKPPFLNFNVGTLGYMAIYSCEKVIEVLDELFRTDKQMTFEKRATLKVKVFTMMSEKDSCSIQMCLPNQEQFKAHDYVLSFQGEALNDVVFEKVGTTMNTFKIYLNDEPLTVVKSDWVIVSTSTGSTAYNLSAGGSIVHYDVDMLILNAICPHSLSFRSIGLPRDIKLKFVPCSSYKKIMINLDGTVMLGIEKNQYIEVFLSNNYCNFIVLEKFVTNRINLWKGKIVNQLGWNNAFKNVEWTNLF